METVFSGTHYPDISTREHLAFCTGLPEAKVQVHRITHWVRDLDYIFSRKIRRDGWKCEVGLGEIGWKYEEIRRVYRAKTILTGNVRLRRDWASNRTRITWNNRVSFQNCLEEVKLECC